MRKKIKYLLGLFLLLLTFATGCTISIDFEDGMAVEQESTADAEAVSAVSESGEYTAKEEVAAYLHSYGHLPDNFITKKEAKKLGWVSSEG